MTRIERSEDALVVMAAANPAAAPELRAALDEGTVEEAMRRAIAIAGSPSQPIPPGDRVANDFGSRAGRSRRRPALVLGSALACLAAVTVLLLLDGGSVGGGSQPAFAAAAIAIAEANPRLLVTAPGWRVSDAGEFERDDGEVTFAHGDRRFTVNWYPARLYRSYLRDRARVSEPQRSTLLGRTATTVRYGVDRNGAEDFATIIAPDGPVFVEARGAIGDRAAYDAVLRSLRPVDVDTWLGAMPRTVVGPDARARVVERMLRGVPLPPRFDRSALQGEEAVMDHY